jgi:hypothetical protein
MTPAAFKRSLGDAVLPGASALPVNHENDRIPA